VSDLQLPHRPQRPQPDVVLRCPRCITGQPGIARANLPSHGRAAMLRVVQMAKHYEEEHDPIDILRLNGRVIWSRDSGEPPPWDRLIEELREP
jgi:hypothetical protein